MRIVQTTLAMLLAATFATAADPQITGTKTAEWLVDLKITDVEKGTAVLWQFYPQDTIRRVGTKKVIPIDRSCAFAGPKGKYDVVVQLVKGEDVKELVDVIELTGGKVPDPVKPPVDPVVPPDPVKPPVDPIVNKASKVAVVIVEETSLRTVEQAKVLGSPTFRQWLQAGGHSFANPDQNDAAVIAAGYMAYRKDSITLPFVLLIDAEAKVASKPLAVFNLPKTDAELQAKVKEVLK